MNTIIVTLTVTFMSTLLACSSAQLDYHVPYPLTHTLQSKTVVPKDINDLNGEYVKRALDDVSSTISQVQKLLSIDPRLPRLTRGEIEELFEQVTNEEFTKSMQLGDHDRAKHMRALMLVLPYNTQNNDSLQDLYTKAPVTKYVDGAAKPKPQPINFEPPSGRVKIVSLKPNDMIYRPPKKVTHSLPAPLVMKPRLPATTTTTTTTSTTTTTTEVPIRVNEFEFTVKPAKHQYSPKAAAFTAAPVRDNVKNMLASIGLFPETKSNLMPFKKLPAFEGLPKMPEATTTTTTQRPTVPELTPELKALLQSFGFLQDPVPSSTASPFTKRFKVSTSFDLPDAFPTLYPSQDALAFEPRNVHITPEIAAEDFTAFKPFQYQESAREAVDTDFENLLKSYGLIENRRAKKSMHTENNAGPIETETPSSTTETPASTPMSTVPTIVVDMLPSGMIRILDTIGISTKKSNHNYDENAAASPKKPRKIGSSRAHGFRPAAQSKSDEEDFQKLNQLLETIKQLDKLNKNLTDDEISQLNIKNYNFSASLLNQGPDPLDYLEHLQEKNEIKRQEIKDPEANPVRISLLDLEEGGKITSEETVVAEASTASNIALLTDSTASSAATSEFTTEASTDEAPSTETATEESRASDLADSFPGVDPVTEEPLPAPRRNGFYFLTDINKFLEVGEDPDKVEVKYARKFGDPSRWISVSVP